MKVNLYFGDSLEAMKTMPENKYSLAIVDPPYGIGISSNPVRQKHSKKNWDDNIPNKEYFDEIKRTSNNQIIWGGNYFLDFLGNSQGFLIWDKKQPEDFSLAMCEFAWSSIQSPAKMFRYSIQTEQNKQHPTQKPVQLYKWILSKYAKEGDTILDTHGGSMSHVIACIEMGYSIDCWELDEEYFNKAVERIQNHVKQLNMFQVQPIINIYK